MASGGWLEIAALLRIVPYIVIAVIGIRKGFRWLSTGSIMLVLTSVANFVFTLSPDVRAGFGSLLSFILLKHALDLKSRR